ncbi:MAG: response regulator [Actinobacteria bacterium]|nr:response regulator [Actinomycetota bacterium]
MAGLRVMIVEDEPLYRELLEVGVISRIKGTTVVGSFGTAEAALESAAHLQPDVLLTDIDLGAGMNGVSLGIEARRRTSVRGVVLLSNLALPTVLSTLPPDLQGGWSYLLKTSVSDVGQVGRATASAERGEVLVDEYLVAQLVAQPNTPIDRLTPRQVEVLSGMARGWSNRRIAEELTLTTRTVESIISNIITNLDLREGEDGINPRVSSVLVYLQHAALELHSGAVSNGAAPRD